MSAGIPLDDDDRRPWLEELAGVLAAAATANRPVVLTCSALQRAYRAQLGRGAPDLVFVHLSCPREGRVRSAERRVGNECIDACIVAGAPQYNKKKTNSKSRSTRIV